MQDIDEIQNALSHVDPSDRDTWVNMGAALKDELGEEGHQIWDQWSQQADSYKPRDAGAVWKSLKPGFVTINTLFYEAKQKGYTPSKPYTPPSPEEKARRAAEAEARRAAELQKHQVAQGKAKRSANAIWRNNGQAKANHPYLVSKGITNHKIISQLKQSQYKGNQNLIIPIYQNREIVSLQFINQLGDKNFLSNGQVKGSYTLVGDGKGFKEGLVLTEGYATAASIHEATGKPVLVAFNAGNLVTVAERLAKSLPADVKVMIAADNDLSQTGLNKAKEAAAQLGERASVAMPTFTRAQIEQYQNSFGQDKLPSDFNDLHQLAGHDAVLQQMNTPLVGDRQVWPNPERTPWGDFPPVIRNSDLGALKNEPEYLAAKGGDPEAAMALVSKLITEETVQEVQNLIGDKQPYLVPVTAVEAAGKNKIPMGMARALSAELSLPIAPDILQANKVARTGKGIDYRFAFSPNFTGDVTPGKDYLLIDDSLSVGGTLASLKGYIESQGGKVVGAAVMTAHEGALNIVVKQPMIDAIGRKHGTGMDEFFKRTFGYGIDKLTQGEAGHLRAAPNVDALRTRIFAARNEGLSRNHGETISDASLQHKEAGPEIGSSPPIKEPIQPTAQEAVFLRPDQVKEVPVKEENQDQQNEIEFAERQQSLNLGQDGFEAKAEPIAGKPTSDIVDTEPGQQADKDAPGKPILDFRYKTPPDGLAARYIFNNGKYLSSDNNMTVLFTDNGKKLVTAKTDMQTTKDMLEVAKAKGWESIKIKGTPDFKRMMYIAAESQGIKTKGYKPTKDDLDLVAQLRSEQSLNQIESEAERSQTVDQDKRNAPPEPPLEKEPAVKVEPEPATADAAPSMPEMDDLPPYDDTAFYDVPFEDLPHELGNSSTAEVAPSQGQDVDFMVAKHAYMAKAEKLSQPQREKLAFYERATMQSIEGLNGPDRAQAIQNFYESTVTHMKGGRLDLPAPMYIPQEQAISSSPSVDQEPSLNDLNPNVGDADIER
ncbi:PriCT-2 domain-containing protein [Neisseriaceae bacterium CLB008]